MKQSEQKLTVDTEKHYMESQKGNSHKHVYEGNVLKKAKEKQEVYVCVRVCEAATDRKLMN